MRSKGAPTYAAFALGPTEDLPPIEKESGSDARGVARELVQTSIFAAPPAEGARPGKALMENLPEAVGLEPTATVLGLLTEIRDELRGLREASEQLRAPKNGHDPASAELLASIVAAVGSRHFSTWELVDHARLPAAARLRDAIVGAVGAENCRKLGKKLEHIEGVGFGGLHVARVGNNREGARWAVEGVRE